MFSILFAILIAAFIIGVIRFILHIPGDVANDFRQIRENRERKELLKLASMTDDQKLAYQEEQRNIMEEKRKSRLILKKQIKEQVKDHKAVLFFTAGLFFLGFVIGMTTEYTYITFILWIISTISSCMFLAKQKLDRK